MGRRRNSNRRRRGRSGFLYRMLSLTLICVCIVAALTMFFRVDHIVVTGGSRYTEEQLIEAAGIRSGANLFLLNKRDIANRILEHLPYVQEVVNIDRRPPNTLAIEVKECGRPLTVVQDGVAWLISPRGKIVEQRPSGAEEKGEIDGCSLLAPSVGTKIALAAEYSLQRSSLLELLEALEEEGMLEQVDAIHLGDAGVLTMDYAGRFTVRLSYGADYSHKMKRLSMILAGDVIQDNMTGTFDMLGENSMDVFRQNVR